MARDTTIPLAGDTLVYPGGAVKALDDDGRFEGLLIPFSTADAPDLSAFRDYFTTETELGFDEDGTFKCVVLYNHGMDPVVGSVPFGRAELKTIDAGVWMKGQIKLRDAYLKKYGAYADQLKTQAKAGTLGLSSGCLKHVMHREPQPNGTHRVLSWIVGEASLTPTPADPRAVTSAIKSLAEIKGLFLGDDSDGQIAFAAVDRAFDLARWRIRDHLGAGDRYGVASKPRADRIAAIGGCLDELRSTALRAVEALVPMEGADGGEGAATKATAMIDQLLSRLR